MNDFILRTSIALRPGKRLALYLSTVGYSEMELLDNPAAPGISHHHRGPAVHSLLPGTRDGKRDGRICHQLCNPSLSKDLRVREVDRVYRSLAYITPDLPDKFILVMDHFIRTAAISADIGREYGKESPDVLVLVRGGVLLHRCSDFCFLYV